MRDYWFIIMKLDSQTVLDLIVDIK
jgi:hypothetical protein